MKLCPHCGEKAHRSQSRGFLERRLLKPLRIRAYRCRECGLRFHRFSLSDHSHIRNHHCGTPAEIRRRGEKDRADYETLVATLRDGEKKVGPAAEPEDEE